MGEPTQTILATVKQGIEDADMQWRVDRIIRKITLNILQADRDFQSLIDKTKLPPQPEKIVCRTQNILNPQAVENSKPVTLPPHSEKEADSIEEPVVKPESVAKPEPVHRTQDPKELQFMKDMESTKIEGDAFYQTLLTESQGRVDTYNLEMKVAELKEEISRLTLKLREAESEMRSNKSELEIKSETIEALKETGTKHLKDRDIAAMHLKLKAEQVTSLKGSIETLKASLEEVLSEKAEIMQNLLGGEEDMAKLKIDHEKLQENYEHSLQDLKSIPEFKALENLVKDKEDEVLHYKEAKEALKVELLKSREAWKREEEKMLDVRRAYEEEIKAMQGEMQEISRSMSWSQEELVRMESKAKEAETEAQRRTEEATELTIKLRSIETEIKAGVEVEKMKAQIMVESMQNELRWREKLFKSQLETAQKQADTAMLEKLRLQKQMTQFEAALHDEQRNSNASDFQPAPPAPAQRQVTPRNKRLLMKHRYLEMENIDQEIARLKHEMLARAQYHSAGDVSLPPIYPEEEQTQRKFFEGAEQKPVKQRVRKTKRARAKRGGWS